jgi:hypothetical protein
MRSVSKKSRAVASQLSGLDGFWAQCFAYVGPGHFLQASVCKRWHEQYSALHSTTTRVSMVIASAKLFKFAQAYGLPLSASISNIAAASGHLAVLRRVAPLCECTAAACSAAARAGKLNTLTFLHDHGCSWDSECYQLAAARGSVRILDFLLWNGCERPQEAAQELWRSAALGGHVTTLDWLQRHYFPNESWTPLCEAAIEGDKVKVLDWAKRMRCQLNGDWSSVAARHGSMAALRYFLDAGCEGLEVCYSAAQHNQLAVLEYAHQRGLLWDEEVCSVAAENGHLAALTYAHENGCPWDAEVRSHAAPHDYWYLVSGSK